MRPKLKATRLLTLHALMWCSEKANFYVVLRELSELQSTGI